MLELKVRIVCSHKQASNTIAIGTAATITKAKSSYGVCVIRKINRGIIHEIIIAPIVRIITVESDFLRSDSNFYNFGKTYFA